MVSNKRLVPLLSQVDGRLIVKLVARSANPGQIKPLKLAVVKNASFMLRGCKLAKIVNSKLVDVLGEGSVPRGIAEIVVEETYGETGTETVDVKSVAQVIKKDVEI